MGLAAREAGDVARALEETVDRMKAATDADRKTIFDLWAAMESDKDTQGLLRNEIGTLTTTVPVHEDGQKKLEAYIAGLAEASKKSDSELQQARDL